jgi:STE24 endopeptidase
MWILIGLLVLRFAISSLLSALNLRHLRARVAEGPAEKWLSELDTEQFPRMVEYTAAKTRLGHAARLWDLAVTVAILLSGLLPASARWSASLSIAPVFQGLLMLAIPSAIEYVASIPFDLASQFGVEKRFGFSTITVQTWITDQLKSLLLMAVLGTLLGGGLLLLIGWLGYWWWAPAWGLLSLFQLLMTFIAPVLILPLFNKFEPLEDEMLRDRILDLADEADFPLEGVYQVDASRRSTHSNAYFTGLGKTRRIALFDTLIEQLSHEQILSVLAHEIGHWVKHHVIWMMVGSILASGAGLWLAATLLRVPWIYEAIGAGDLYARLGPQGPIVAIGLYVIGILISPVGLIVSPVANWLSRRNEYQADAYALQLHPHPRALEQALIQLSEENLSNLFPHPLVVVFRYSHPPLRRRVSAIRERAEEMGRPAEP